MSETRLNPDRGWRHGRYSRALWACDTMRDLVRLLRGRRWYQR